MIEPLAFHLAFVNSHHMTFLMIHHKTVLPIIPINCDMNLNSICIYSKISLAKPRSNIRILIFPGNANPFGQPSFPTPPPLDVQIRLSSNNGYNCHPQKPIYSGPYFNPAGNMPSYDRYPLAPSPVFPMGPMSPSLMISPSNTPPPPPPLIVPSASYVFGGHSNLSHWPA